MSTTHLVKHPKFTADDFKSKTLCWYHRGTPYVYRLAVPVQEADGRFVMIATSTIVDLDDSSNSVSNNVPESQISIQSDSLDQSTVDKIEAAVSPAIRGRCDFALFEGYPGSAELNRA